MRLSFSLSFITTLPYTPRNVLYLLKRRCVFGAHAHRMLKLVLAIRCCARFTGGPTHPCRPVSLSSSPWTRQRCTRMISKSTTCRSGTRSNLGPSAAASITPSGSNQSYTLGTWTGFMLPVFGQGLGTMPARTKKGKRCLCLELAAQPAAGNQHNNATVPVKNILTVFKISRLVSPQLRGPDLEGERRSCDP